MQPLPLLAPGPADLLGCGRHRGSPPPIHAWLRLPAQLSHTGKIPSTLCPEKAFRSKVMYSSPPVSFNKIWTYAWISPFLLPSCSPLPDLKLIQFPSLFYFPQAPNVPPFLSAIFGLVPPFLISLPLHPPLSHSSFMFIWTCTNIDFEWLVVLLELHCQQHRSLKELFMLHQNRNKQYTGLHGGSQMDVFIYPCCHKKGLLKIVMSIGFLEQLYTIFWPWDRCD